MKKTQNELLHLYSLCWMRLFGSPVIIPIILLHLIGKLLQTFNSIVIDLVFMHLFIVIKMQQHYEVMRKYVEAQFQEFSIISVQCFVFFFWSEHSILEFIAFICRRNILIAITSLPYMQSEISICDYAIESINNILIP